MEYAAGLLKIVKEFNVEGSTLLPVGAVGYACADITSVSRIVAGLCHYSLREPNPVSPNIAPERMTNSPAPRLNAIEAHQPQVSPME
jgi:hypothetical protein